MIKSLKRKSTVALTVFMLVGVLFLTSNFTSTQLLAASCSVHGCSCECATGTICMTGTLWMGFAGVDAYVSRCECYGEDGEYEDCNIMHL